MVSMAPAKDVAHRWTGHHQAFAQGQRSTRWHPSEFLRGVTIDGPFRHLVRRADQAAPVFVRFLALNITEPSFLLTANSDDFFFFHLYGTFQDSFTLNSTIEVRIDCGSHCEEYGNPPGEMPGESFLFDYCEYSNIMQPTGGEKRNVTCPPEKGWALIETLAYIWPMFLRVPVRFTPLHAFCCKSTKGM